MTRTQRVGYLRDIRRLTVALSRARLGLYVLGRRDVFETCHELQQSFDRLLMDRPDTLLLVTNEMYGSRSRKVADDVKGIEMTGVEHLGQYVYEMTKAKIEASKSAGQPLAISMPEEDVKMDEDKAEEGGEYGNGEAINPEFEELDEID